MKKALILSLLVAASTSITALADTISIVPGYGPYQSGNGGEITVTLSTPVSGYVPGVTSGFVQSGTFQTFCLELHESLVNGTFVAVPADVTQLSGITLNKGTAWLYQQFAAGTLSGYNYGPNAVDRKASAAALQAEIWHLMGNQDAANPTFDALVMGALGATWSDPNTSAFSPVRLVNVWDIGLVGQREGARQDVLYIPGTSVPDGGLTLALLGMGLTGIGVISRRIRK
jgi:hypothetical protein